MRTVLSVIMGGVILGVLWRSFFDFGIHAVSLVLLLGVALCALSFALADRRRTLLASLAVIAFGLGIVRLDIAELHRGSALLDSMVGSEAVFHGVIVDEPDIRESNTNYTVRIEDAAGTSVSEKVRVIAESYPAFRYGDKIILKGALMKPEGFETETGRYFDYVSYLAKDDIFYQMLFPEMTHISSGHGHVVKQYLFDFKNAFLAKVQRAIPDPEASLLGGLVVGAKQSLGERLQADFRATGIIHIVVLSGYNVTIVAEAIVRSFAFLPRLAGISLGAGSIVLFAIMVGGSATIVRASIMALLVILARATGRTYDITWALFVAGFGMVMHNPKILLHDASFQLSFLATLGLIWLAPAIERYLGFVPSRFQFREFATATIATQIFVLPLLLYKIGELSLVALPVNLLVLVTVPITMLFGFLAGIIAFVSGVLAVPFAYIAYALLSYQLAVVEFFARLPFASIQIDAFPLWLMLALYALYGVVLYRMYRKGAVSEEKRQATEAVQAS